MKVNSYPIQKYHLKTGSTVRLDSYKEAGGNLDTGLGNGFFGHETKSKNKYVGLHQEKFLQSRENTRLKRQAMQ
jgi:hypothetical protein